ncbi:zinc metalloprotease HtpX [Deltaproteobacteria bacterium OttesenSCG-928-M10]|nr:zinc metalloprotease HtpX [Deltaproteobacteria bacterium OttesenSCG-928-M10]
MVKNLHNRFRTVALLALMTVLIMIFGEVMGGAQGLKIAFVIAMLMNLGSWWFSADLVLAQTGAKVVGPAEAPELYELVAHLAERAELPVPRVAIVDDPAPNAFATGRNPAHGVVAVTTGLLSIMNREELAGVLSHELTHIKNRDILVGSVAAVMAGVIMLLANIAKFSFMFLGGRGQGDQGAGNPIAAILLAILAPFAAMLIQAAISRSREYLADDGGADIAGTPYGLASALTKLANYHQAPRNAAPNTAHMYITNPLNSRSLRNLFATHPPIEERIARLQGQIP